MITRQELQALKSGYLTSNQAFDDYGIDPGRPYKVSKVGEGYGIDGAGWIMTSGFEIRSDMLLNLSWSETK